MNKFIRRYGRTTLSSWRRQFASIKKEADNTSTASASASASTSPAKTQSLFAWYSGKLDTHPITTKCITSGFISSAGNCFAQRITFENEQQAKLPDSSSTDEEDIFEINWNQVGRFAFLNVALVTPLLHHWYQFINNAVPGNSLSRVIQRVCWDEFFFTPMYIPVVMGTLWTLEGTSLPKVWTMVKNESLKLVMAEWVVWVPTMFITFRYIPVKFQVLTINIVGVFWSTFLSFMSTEAHKNAAREDGENAAKQNAASLTKDGATADLPSDT